MATETTTTPRTAGEWLFYIFSPACAGSGEETEAEE
jgi:hypothetical protein